MNFSLKNSRGFTLIELLVVIAIIGLLSSVVLASLNSARGKARDARRKADLAEVQKALELYYDTSNSYPGGPAFSPWAATWSVDSSPYTRSLYNAVGGTYIPVLPADPVNKESMPGNFLGDDAPTDQGYVYASDGHSYILGSNLEQGGGAKSNCGNYQLRGGANPAYVCPL